MTSTPGDSNTRDEELLADLFDSLLQDILDGRTPALEPLQLQRPDLRERIAKTWQLACSVAGRREPSRPVLGGYEIVRELGHGGMGTVYLARHLTLQRNVAIKVLPHSLAMSPKAKQRFVEEARSLAQIRHENVVHIHRIIDHAEMLAFEMEFVDGPSLQHLIVAMQRHDKPHSLASLAAALGRDASAIGSRSSVEWFVGVAIRIARALGEVHRHGLVHRDVKPGNILLRADGVPMLADFGLALAGDLVATRTKFAGTPVYAAPERLRGNEDAVDARTDVYSLGVTLYEALTMTPPFAGNTTHEVLRRIESGHAASLRERAPHVSRDLATIVQKAMERDPRHRYATADDLADDLERLLDLQPIRAQPAGPVRRALKFVRRHQRVVVTAVASAVLVGLGLWPIAAHAADAQARREQAATALHAARTQLLCPEVLPSSWASHATAGRTLQQSERSELRALALAAARTHYARAVALAPDDDRLRLEHAVVDVLATDPADHGPHRTEATLPPLCRLLASNVTMRRRLAEGVDAALQDAAPADRLAAGLLAFVAGDHELSHRCWDELPNPLRTDPLVEACTALGLAEQGAAERAYPRLFQAAHAFPEARALALGLADAAIAAGDLPLARQWIAALPPAIDERDAARRRLLAADLLAAEGQIDAAAMQYRALCAADASDPVPLQHLADLALRSGDLSVARRMLESMLTRWPDLAPVRLQLARLCLQRRDTAGYLAHARHALGQLRRETTPATASLHTILALGGLHSQNGADASRTPSTAWRNDSIPLDSWLPRSHVVGIERALHLHAAYDQATATASRLDARPLGASLRAVWLTMLELPRLPVRLPWQLQAAGIAGIPALLGHPTDLLTKALLPYQRALGTRFHSVPKRLLFQHGTSLVSVYGHEVLRVGDIDGDTLDDLCVTSPPAGTGGAGTVEIRSEASGALLHTWEHADEDVMFGRAVAALGDIDGDRCADLLVGAPLRRTPATAGVEAWSGRTGTCLWRITDSTASFGAALAALGDLDGDGHRDFVVGRSPLALHRTGSAEIRSGKDGHLLHALACERTGVWFGGAVAPAGDVTGDGVDDVLVAGNFGGAPGLVTVFDGATGKPHASFSEEDPDAMFGHSVVATGDLDGDGRGDIAIAAPGGSGSKDAGRVVVLSGRTGKALYELRGERPREGFGASLRWLPDWRGDGKPALAVATRNGGPIGRGYVRVFDLQHGAPLQTYAAAGAIRLGVAMLDLGDRDGDGLRELGVSALFPDDRFELGFFSFADAFAPPAPGAALEAAPSARVRPK